VRAPAVRQMEYGYLCACRGCFGFRRLKTTTFGGGLHGLPLFYRLPNSFLSDTSDTFYIKTNKTPEKFHLTIFNRWGNPVFETEDIEQHWDGEYKNKQCTDGVYYYTLELKFDTRTQTEKGYIYLKR